MADIDYYEYFKSFTSAEPSETVEQQQIIFAKAPAEIINNEKLKKKKVSRVASAGGAGARSLYKKYPALRKF